MLTEFVSLFLMCNSSKIVLLVRSFSDDKIVDFKNQNCGHLVSAGERWFPLLLYIWRIRFCDDWLEKCRCIIIIRIQHSKFYFIKIWCSIITFLLQKLQFLIDGQDVFSCSWSNIYWAELFNCCQRKDLFDK